MWSKIKEVKISSNHFSPYTPDRYGDMHSTNGKIPPRSSQPEAIAVKGHNHDGCLERVPYASLMATVMCGIGVILFSIMIAWGFNATAEQTRRTLKLDDWPWLDKVQIFFVVILILMIVFALFFLAVGFTATGSTREQMYKEKQAKCGGRCVLGFSMALTVALILSWIAIIMFLSAICFSYIVFHSICGDMVDFSETQCLDLSIFRPLIDKFSKSTLKLCGGDAQQFCALTSTARSWYIVGLVGSIIVLLGLCKFLAIHSANFSNIGNASRYVELRDLFLEPSTPPVPSIPPPMPNRYPEGPRHPRSYERSRLRERKGSYTENSTYSDNKSMSRMAENKSDTFSQYQYGRKYNP
ncbi:unnamed protein product [Auanema sp. JU1783]|nr:unnamed protein product [Auanema sp. JU1783]